MADSVEDSRIIYEVSAQVRADLVDDWLGYMETKHLPDMLATGCFIKASLMKSESGRFRTEYVAPSRADLDRYLADHAALLRPHAKNRFPDGVNFEREIWCPMAVLSDPAAEG